jgi:hypothetical protein
MTITKGLVIDDPWITYILNGSKTWEMRSSATAQRGWVGLIRKGTGEVQGIARVVGCGAALSEAAMLETIERHRIPERMIRSGAVSKWVVPWELANVIQLPQPVPYQHRNGAVTWVGLDPDVQDALAHHIPGEHLNETGTLLPKTLGLNAEAAVPSYVAQTRDVSPAAKASAPAPDMPNPEQTVLGRTLLSGGNIRNNHFYLTGFLDKFPTDAIGGSNKHDRAPNTMMIDWGGPHPVHSDIDKSKRFFRSRGWVGDFFAATGATENDTVVILGLSPYSVRVKLEKRDAR